MASSDQISASPTRSILVTDSGLGGLSVFSEIANGLEQGSPWPSVRLVYFNAWPAPHRGYNHFDSKEKRARVFNNALTAMAAFDPDLILIACNTLSVIYPHTPFFEATDIAVEGIVDHGVQMVYEKLMADPDGMAILLGTPTTIEAGSHERELVRLGIAKERIIGMGCANLAGWIEREPFSATVHAMIRNCVQAAAAKLGNCDGHLYAALCCTHFGYRHALFKQAFAEFVTAQTTILNPNMRMARQLFASVDASQSFSTQIEMRIVSKAKWTDAQVTAYLKLLPDISPATRDALLNYELDPQLFSAD